MLVYCVMLVIFLTQVTLNNYTFENVAFHLLHQRFSLYTQRTLSEWFDHNSDIFRYLYKYVVDDDDDGDVN